MNDSSPPPPETRPNVPEGFAALALSRDRDFMSVVGPLYGKGGGVDLVLGFRVEQRHCNPLGICHGGMLSTFADMTLAIGANHAARIGRFLPTVSLDCDFLAPAPLGSWVEGRTQVLRVTRTMVFAQCLVTANGTPAVRSSGVFKIGEPFATAGSGIRPPGVTQPEPSVESE